MKRRDTRMSFDESRDALKRFESTVVTQPQVFEDSVENSPDDEGTQVFVHGRQVLVVVHFNTEQSHNSYILHF